MLSPLGTRCCCGRPSCGYVAAYGTCAPCRGRLHACTYIPRKRKYSALFRIHQPTPVEPLRDTGCLYRAGVPKRRQQAGLKQRGTDEKRFTALQLRRSDCGARCHSPCSLHHPLTGLSAAALSLMALVGFHSLSTHSEYVAETRKNST